ncbi:hypothetical protein H4K35_00365 [Myroides sp. NP-2]|uniref:hypothetical protein n=1 Tax=Myroides sp. NP-2 TaxID=2759945 RepID=UPI0015FD8F7B|nr:hypothetical protein [Myroides sp. NP-2]MBB1148598.1 hypothetical protein [Myroides sp. NP-2]
MIYKILSKGNTSLASRKKIREDIEKQPNVLSTLVEFTFDPTSKVNVLASIVLDDLVQVNPHLLDDYIVFFIENLPRVTDESVKRLTSKMAVLLLEKRGHLLTVQQEEQLVDQSLVWLTTETKVATEANAMQMIVLLCKKFPTQAKLIAELIEVNYTAKTPAYQSMARKLLKCVQKLE